MKDFVEEKAFVAGYRGGKMTDKEIQASDEEMEQFSISQNEKCVSVKKEKLNDLMNKISFALKDAALAQGFEIICKRIAEMEKENEELKKKLCLMRKWIYGNFDFEDKIEQLKFIDEFGKELSE